MPWPRHSVTRRSILDAPAPPAVKVLITGAGGQVGRALLDTVPDNFEAIRLHACRSRYGRRRGGTRLVGRHRPASDHQCRGVYRGRQGRSGAGCRAADQRRGPGPSGRGGPGMRRPADPHLHGFRVRWRRIRSLSAGFRHHPLSVYGRSKRDGERAALEGLPGAICTIVRTAWVYAATGAQLRAHHAAHHAVEWRRYGWWRIRWAHRPRRASSPRRCGGSLRDPEIRGIHHWTDAGVASWYDFAVAIAEEGATARAALARGRLSRRSPPRITRRLPAAPPTACSTSVRWLLTASLPSIGASACAPC